VALNVIRLQPVRGAFPRSIALAPGGGWLLTAGVDLNTGAVRHVNPVTGMLVFQTQGLINVPGAICIVFAKRS
jgi:6-phosphogluconolactonase